METGPVQSVVSGVAILLALVSARNIRDISSDSDIVSCIRSEDGTVDMKMAKSLFTSAYSACISEHENFIDEGDGYLHLRIPPNNAAWDKCVFETTDHTSSYVMVVATRHDEWVEEFKCDFVTTHNRFKHSAVSDNDPSTEHPHLYVTDALGNILSHINLLSDTPIRIVLAASGMPGAVGIRPTSCVALGTTNHGARSILRDGCGRGVLNRIEGFVTDGMISRSPTFKPFAIDNDKILRFECNLTICTDNCDGNTCKAKTQGEVSDDSGQITKGDNSPYDVSTNIDVSSRTDTFLINTTGSRSSIGIVQKVTNVQSAHTNMDEESSKHVPNDQDVQHSPVEDQAQVNPNGDQIPIWQGSQPDIANVQTELNKEQILSEQSASPGQVTITKTNEIGSNDHSYQQNKGQIQNPEQREHVIGKTAGGYVGPAEPNRQVDPSDPVQIEKTKYVQSPEQEVSSYPPDTFREVKFIDFSDDIGILKLRQPEEGPQLVDTYSEGQDPTDLQADDGGVQGTTTQHSDRQTQGNIHAVEVLATVEKTDQSNLDTLDNPEEPLTKQTESSDSNQKIQKHVMETLDTSNPGENTEMQYTAEGGRSSITQKTHDVELNPQTQNIADRDTRLEAEDTSAAHLNPQIQIITDVDRNLQAEESNDAQLNTQIQINDVDRSLQSEKPANAQLNPHNRESGVESEVTPDAQPNILKTQKNAKDRSFKVEGTPAAQPDPQTQYNADGDRRLQAEEQSDAQLNPQIQIIADGDRSLQGEETSDSKLNPQNNAERDLEAGETPDDQSNPQTQYNTDENRNVGPHAASDAKLNPQTLNNADGDGILQAEETPNIQPNPHNNVAEDRHVGHQVPSDAQLNPYTRGSVDDKAFVPVEASIPRSSPTDELRDQSETFGEHLQSVDGPFLNTEKSEYVPQVDQINKPSQLTENKDNTQTGIIDSNPDPIEPNHHTENDWTHLLAGSASKDLINNNIEAVNENGIEVINGFELGPVDPIIDANLDVQELIDSYQHSSDTASQGEHTPPVKSDPQNQRPLEVVSDNIYQIAGDQGVQSEDIASTISAEVDARIQDDKTEGEIHGYQPNVGSDVIHSVDNLKTEPDDSSEEPNLAQTKDTPVVSLETDSFSTEDEAKAAVDAHSIHKPSPTLQNITLLDAPRQPIEIETVLITEAKDNSSSTETFVLGSTPAKFAVGAVVVVLFALSFLGILVAHCRRRRTQM